MWTANIESKEFNKGLIQVGVVYSNDKDKFTEIYQIQSLDQLNSFIQGKLGILNSIDIAQIPLGDSAQISTILAQVK